MFKEEVITVETMGRHGVVITDIEIKCAAHVDELRIPLVPTG